MLPRIITFGYVPAIDLRQLRAGETVTARTKNTTYVITADDIDVLYIEGHPKYCPTRTRATFTIFGVGHRIPLVFTTGDHPLEIMTSPVLEARLHIPGVNEGPLNILIDGLGDRILDIGDTTLAAYP